MPRAVDFGEGRRLPGYAKGIMLLETFGILFLSWWIIEEYTNNVYLQAYVSGTFQVYGLLIVIALIVGAVAVVFGLLKASRSSDKQVTPSMNKPETDDFGVGAGGYRATGSARTSAEELHPMVAAMKADLAQRGSMEPVPPPEADEATSQNPDVSAPPPSYQPAPPPPKTMTSIPSTVITGTMPVLRKVNPEDKNKGASA